MPPRKFKLVEKIISVNADDADDAEDADVQETIKIEPKKKEVSIPKKKEVPIPKKKEVSIPNKEVPIPKKEHVKNTLLKQTESSFDMFGDDNVDYREILMKYDYTKNKTLPKITKYEKALLIGKRAKQIEEGANPNIKVMPGQGAISIAEEELRQRVIPLIIKRPNGNKFEYWKPADMEVVMD